MGERIVECVPNVSEGRRREVMDALKGAVVATPGVTLLDHHWDADHNRSVFTFAGGPESVSEAAFRLCEQACRRIDLQRYEGAHPHIGATDVVPFIPVQGVEMGECVELAERLGERVARELSIPVYLYGEAARSPERRTPSRIRKGNWRGLQAALERGERGRAPDMGPKRLHPTAGATAVGARPPLIALNVELGTTDVEVAQAIALRVRGTGGGLTHVQAMGVRLAAKGVVQVSMNLLDYRSTPLYRAFELVRVEASRFGVPVTGSELVGLIPADALAETAAYYLRMHGFSGKQVLERRLAEAARPDGSVDGSVASRDVEPEREARDGRGIDRKGRQADRYISTDEGAEMDER